MEYVGRVEKFAIATPKQEKKNKATQNRTAFNCILVVPCKMPHHTKRKVCP
jgi:hypothetical protein